MVTAADIRPSGAAAWSRCALYVALAAAYREAMEADNNDVREDGTACHWHVAERLMGRTPEVGTMSPNSRVITEEMFDAGDIYIDVLREWSDVEWYIEQPVDCGIILPGMKGTPDAWAYHPQRCRLRVADLKFGFGFVEVYHNLQLTIYATSIGALLQLPDDTEVELIIIQPRAYSREGDVRRWVTTMGFLRTIAADLSAAAHRALQPQPVATVGNWCIECEGRIACDSFMKTCQTLVDFSGSPYHYDVPVDKLDAELLVVSDAIEKLEGRKSALEVTLERHLRNGGSAAHHKLASGTGRERWVEGTEAMVIRLAQQLFNVNIAKPITPAQARRKIPSVLVDSMTTRGPSALKLVKVGKYDAEKAFNKK